MQELVASNSATIRASVSTVYINGNLEPRLRCSTVEAALGPVPGKAFLMLGSNVYTEWSPRTLYSTPTYDRWKYGSRVEIKANGTTCFLGSIVQRMDSGAADAPIWVAFDDKWLLSKFPVRGCFVCDNDRAEEPTYTAKFISRYLPHFNPQGWWNCMGYQDQNWGLVPLFAPYAQQRPFDYQKQFSQTFTELVAGQLTCWTPRRAIEYLRYMIFIGNVPGWTKNRHYRTMINSNRIVWPSSYNLGDGNGGQGGYDPLDMKLQDCNVTNMNMLEALCEVLHKAGTHEIGTELHGSKSYISFYARKQPSHYNSGVNIYVRRGGVVRESNVAIDFDLFEDATNTVDAVLVEGSEHKLETELSYDADLAAGDPKKNTNTLDVAWDPEDERKFKKVIWGGDDIETLNDYAMIPSVDGGEPDTICNGTGPSPIGPISARSSEAIAYARQLYPDVFMEFRINMKNMIAQTIKVMYGLTGEEYKNEADYPIITAIRQAFDTQLTKLNIGGEDLFARLPARIQVKTGGTWYDSRFLNGFQASAQTIRLQGLAENLDKDDPSSPTENDCIYENSLYSTWANNEKPYDLVTVKSIKINLAIPLDHRVEGYRELSQYNNSQLHYSLATEFGGRVMAAELNPAYLHEYRKNSYPKPGAKLGDTDIENNQQDIDWTAYRTLNRSQYTDKRSNWIFPGINLAYKPGGWVKSIKVIEGSGSDRDYPVYGLIPSVVYDFLNQITRTGGILHYQPTPSIEEPEHAAPGDQKTSTPKAAEKASDAATSPGITYGEKSEMAKPDIYDKGIIPGAEVVDYGGNA